MLAEVRQQAEAEVEQLRQELDQIRGQMATVPREKGKAGRSVHEQWLSEAQDVLAERSGQLKAPPAIADAAAGGHRRAAPAG